MRPIREEPGPGQVSVWDFPRPPDYVQWHELVEIRFGGSLIASTTEAWCVLETSHPPTYYLPRSAFAPGSLRRAEGASYCEWKGRAVYYDVVADGGAGDAAVEGLHVRVAQAGGGHPDTDFSRAWRPDVDLDELDGTVGLQLHGCLGHVCFLSCC